MSVNKLILLGNLGDDVKTHAFKDGNVIGKFPLATSETYKNKQGEKITETEWHNIVCRNKQAETLEKFLSKGDQLYLEGKIKTNVWENKEGVKQYSKEIHLLNFSFVSKSSDNAKQNEPIKSDDFERTDGINEQPDDLPF